MRQIDYLIVGGGITGIGGAYRLKKMGVSSFVVLESTDRIGGLAASFKDDAGFTWDLGGHVLFSKDQRFIQHIDDAMGDDLLAYCRRARVHVKGQWTGYPFQNHVHELSPDLAKLCQDGLANAPGLDEGTRSFKDWMVRSFGDGICRLFMEPYNRKVWVFPLRKMGFQWIGDRVSVVQNNPNESIEENAGQKQWGPNSEFLYPRNDGIGAIASRIGNEFCDHIRFHHEVIKIDPIAKVAVVKGGISYKYKAVLSTVPLDRLIKKMIRPQRQTLFAAANRLEYNHVAVVGIGLDMEGDRQTSWMYFPGSECPFYRLTNLHNYSPSITPKGKNQAALMTEVAFSPGQSENESVLVSKVIDGLFTTGIINRSDEKKIISTWSKQIPYAYPIPTLDRDQALAVIHAYLESHNIFSRGRFGGWKYEVGNMDHSFMQGIRVGRENDCWKSGKHFSISVGRVEFYHLRPMTFKEFLDAVEKVGGKTLTVNQ